MSGPREPAHTGAAVGVVPSVKEILDRLAVEAGLVETFDNAFQPDEDEDEAARDVAKIMSALRPVLEGYKHRYEELAGLLTRSQASAASATAGARELSQGQLRTFRRLKEGCAALRQELETAAVSAAAPEAAAAGSPSGPDTPDQQGSGLGAKAATRRRAAAAAQADALAARHRSLVQRRRRMRSALLVLEASERGRAALEAVTEPTRRLAERAEEAMKAIESLRRLLGDYGGRGDGDNDSRSPPPTVAPLREGVAAAAAGSAGRRTAACNETGGSGRVFEEVTADGELARVARGRLEWLTQRLRAYLSSELAAALRKADPLAAGNGVGTGGHSGDVLSEVDEERRRQGLARVKEAVAYLLALQFGQLSFASADASRQAAGGVAEGGGGPVWALDGLLEPVAVRFRFHFEGERPTNRVDRPEWFLSFLLRALEAYRPLLLQLLVEGTGRHGLAAGEGETGSGPGDAGWGSGGVDPLAYFARGLALLARRRLRAQLGAAAADGSLLSHTVEEALAFDRHLDRETGYAECPARFPQQTWPRCVEVFAQGEERFQRWMESDASAAKAKLAEAAASPGAWRAIDCKNGSQSSTPVTASAVAVCRLFTDVTERYRLLRDPLKQLRFAKYVQEPVLRSYRDMVCVKGSDCRLDSVFRDGVRGDENQEVAGAGAGGVASPADGITATWAAALEAAMVGPGQEDDEDKSPVGRWRGYCLAVSSCAYVLAVLRESEDDMLFADMAETAAAAWAAGVEVSEQGREARPSSSLGAMGNVVGAAVGGVSQAVTELATTAETATAGVVRAVGAQGSIIGPTHAISAALTSLKGAARRVRKASSEPRKNGRDKGNVGSGSGSGGGGGGDGGANTGAGTATMIREEEEGGEDEGVGVGVCGAAEGDVGRRGDATASVEEGRTPAAAAAAVIEGWAGSVFGEEAGQYGVMLEAMLRGAVEACRDGFLWRTRSYLRAWDRGIAVVVRVSAAASSPSSGGSSSLAAEPSGRLLEGVELLETAVGVAEGCLPPAQFHQFWTALASELDLALVKQIVARRSEMTQDEGLQLLADLKMLMGPFDSLARRRPEKHFPALVEAAVLLSLEKSQLRSLSSGLDAHGGGVGDAVRGSGWDGWREEGGALSPEGSQMRDMLENVGVRRLGPAEASILLDKRLKGDRLAVLGHLSAAAGESGGGGGSNPTAGSFAGVGGGPVPSVVGGGGDGGADRGLWPGVVGGGSVGGRAGEAPREAVSSFG